MAKNLDVNIDAGNFLDSFRPELPPSTTSSSVSENVPEKQTETRKKKEVRTSDTASEYSGAIKPEDEYEKLFIRDAKLFARSGKLVSIRKEYHDRILRITQVIGKNKLSLSGYIDHVLAHHFDEYEEAIKKLYKKNYEDVY
ncbi:DUF3408 domain-containing protein [Bacteroides graminisolvens]|uniref:DUF3408 domain-containing protein n=1 Tax=Bacteroides graminisolvens TaxID=477666 RepID=UPI002409719B|nr:DUF3408 domain-containing protein [Bacteroides graminisolvens]